MSADEAAAVLRRRAVTDGTPLDQTTSYGAQFHTVYDQLFPPGAEAEQTAEFLLALVDHRAPVVVELGVGSGRIALPLARRGARVTGVDTSGHLLELAAVAAGRECLDVHLTQADIRGWLPAERADLVICVCATLAQLPTAEDRRAALATAAAAVRPGGTVVVETHTPERVRRLHGTNRRVEFGIPLVGSASGVRAVSRLDGPVGPWHLEHHWSDGESARHAIEHASLIEPSELAGLARSVGLHLHSLHGDWTGAPADPLSPTYIAVLIAPDPST